MLTSMLLQVQLFHIFLRALTTQLRIPPRCSFTCLTCRVAGLLTAIVGEPGSGGLSLALLATRMESPSSGCVTLDDTGEINLGV